MRVYSHVSFVFENKMKSISQPDLRRRSCHQCPRRMGVARFLKKNYYCVVIYGKSQGCLWNVHSSWGEFLETVQMVSWTYLIAVTVIVFLYRSVIWLFVLMLGFLSFFSRRWCHSSHSQGSAQQITEIEEVEEDVSVGRRTTSIIRTAVSYIQKKREKKKLCLCCFVVCVLFHIVLSQCF